ncbi:MAG: glutamate--tRNA ligase [Planctomycetaceae bacterium]|nr:glutamate--tRNA ligase [Planctomycetaceae bacterium]
MKPIRTRFAPSPTGYMHIGGMRTALFNWLFAKHHGGVFVLRIDDTDRARNMDQALRPILQSFRWLGLDWDEGPGVEGDFGPYFQSQRDELYSHACEELLKQGKAFRDFTLPEQSKAERESAEKEKRNYLNNRNDQHLSEEDIQSRISNGDKYVIRFLVPRDTDEKIVIDDAVRGRVEFDPTQMPDPVIMRGDGTPLYNFACVIDDAKMQISHVIRAEEHLSNTPIQAMLYDALGYERPVFAHIPYVAAPGGKEKLSKRKLDKYRKSPQFKKLFDAADFVFPLINLENTGELDPVMVEYYEKIGYLPAGLLNALSRLGWSLDDQTEIMSLDTIAKNFSLERVIKSAAGFDPDKLLSFQAHWMGELSAEQKQAGCIPYLKQAGLINDEQEQSNQLEQIIAAIGERFVLFSDILKFNEFFVADEELEFDPKAFKKRIVKPEQAKSLLDALAEHLQNSQAESTEDFDQVVHDFVEKQEIQIGQIIHALRVAVTGKGAGVGMFDAMAILGTESCIKRIRIAIAHNLE